MPDWTPYAVIAAPDAVIAAPDTAVAAPDAVIAAPDAADGTACGRCGPRCRRCAPHVETQDIASLPYAGITPPRRLEFNFRDAKQFWGLEDFMNTHPTQVTNAASLSLFMVNLSHCLRQPFRRRDPAFSLLNLKAHYRGLKYVEEAIKMLPETPEPSLLERIITRMVGLGRIHVVDVEPISA
jgi:hypothetical protein